MAHHHQHHHHDHSQASAGYDRAFAVGIALNTGFVAIEGAYGFIANSMALLGDAGHNLSDVLALLVAWGAAALTRRPPSARFTYGLRGSSILASLFNATVLLIVMGGIGWEAIRRLAAPPPIPGVTMMVVAGIGIAVNAGTALLFAAGRRYDLNIRGAFLHMAADAAVSAGVVVAGALIWTSGWAWLDPAVSLAIVAVVVWSTWDLLRQSIALSLAAVPAGIQPQEVRRYLESLPGVAQIHDLHIWPMSTTETALTCHLLMTDGHPGDGFLVATAEELQHRFAIGHATLQVETSEETACRLAPDHAV